MRALMTLALGAALVTVGCGDSSGDDPPPPADGGGTDGGGVDTGMVMPSCPVTAPDMGAGYMDPCCFRKSNADSLDAPELRMAGLAIQTPGTLAIALVRTLLGTEFDEESFNWLLRAEITGTDVVLTTGYGLRNADNTFSFDPTRFPPAVVNATLDGETISAPQVTSTFDVPIFGEEANPTVDEPDIIFPLQNLEILALTLSENRSCVGTRRRRDYDTNDGVLSAFIGVDDAAGATIRVGCNDMGEMCTVDTDLCRFAAGLSARTEACLDIPRAEWTGLPDSLCDAAGCTRNADGMTDVCDPMTTCNAWQIVTEFAAHGVEITD